MDTSTHKDKLEKSKYSNKILLQALICSTVVNCALVFGLVWQSIHKTVHLVPPVMGQQVSLSSAAPDESYLEMMGLFFMGLKLNVSPDNVEESYEVLATHLDSRSYISIAKRLNKDIQSVKKLKISAAFYPESQEVDLKTLRFKVKGKVKKWVGDGERGRPVSDKTEIYIMQFSYTNGTLKIVDVHKLVKSKK